MQLPQYNGEDNKVMIGTVPIFSGLLNVLLFGKQYISGLGFFVVSTLSTSLAFGVFFIACGAIAVFMKNRFPREEQLTLRMSVMIIVFLVMSGLFMYGLCLTYDAIPYFQYKFSERSFAWAYFCLAVINMFITFLMEGISRYYEWKRSWFETEQLNKVLKKSQLEGLKSQVNPHFLFNSLNSLSSLIQEDEVKAERFLDEMSKVYRYMLRDDGQWVALETEMKFLYSYLHLLHARFGEGLQVNIRIPDAMKDRCIAPLTLQVVVENAITQNVLSKHHPLRIDIEVNSDGLLCIRNNVQRKTNTETRDTEASLDHLVDRYKLLRQPLAVDDSVAGERSIIIPLSTHEIPEPR